MVGDDGLQDEDLYVEFDNASQEDIDAELEKSRNEAVTNCLIETAVQQLKELIAKHKHIFKLRLRTGDPAEITPLKVDLDQTKPPVRRKVETLPMLQVGFLDKYISQLLKMKFIKPCPQAS